MKNGNGTPYINHKKRKEWMGFMKVIEYDSRYKEAFVSLNKHWIEKFFKIEAHDLEQLDHVEQLIEEGAMVFFIVENQQVLSTCMVLELEPNVWEICKFATNEQFQGKGAGRKIFQKAIDYASAHGAEKIVIYSNQLLKPALHLYQSFGFKEVPVDIEEYDRCDYQAELIIK